MTARRSINPYQIFRSGTGPRQTRLIENLSAPEKGRPRRLSAVGNGRGQRVGQFAHARLKAASFRASHGHLGASKPPGLSTAGGQEPRTRGMRPSKKENRLMRMHL